MHNNPRHVTAGQRFEAMDRAYSNSLPADVRDSYEGAPSGSMALFANIFGRMPDFVSYVEKTGQAMPTRLCGADEVNEILDRIKEAHQDQAVEVVKIGALNFDEVMPPSPRQSSYRPKVRAYLMKENFEDPKVEVEAFSPDGRPLGVMVETVDPEVRQLAGKTIYHVVEQKSAGAPESRVYLYIWDGGEKHYNDNPEDRAALMALREGFTVTFDTTAVDEALDRNTAAYDAEHADDLPNNGGFIDDGDGEEPEMGMIG